MRISDGSSDVCSSDLSGGTARGKLGVEADLGQQFLYGGVGRARRLKRGQAFGDQPGGAPAGGQAVDRVLRRTLHSTPVRKQRLPAHPQTVSLPSPLSPLPPPQPHHTAPQPPYAPASPPPHRPRTPP